MQSVIETEDFMKDANSAGMTEEIRQQIIAALAKEPRARRENARHRRLPQNSLADAGQGKSAAVGERCISTRARTCRYSCWR
jgi:hypothetical protein